MEETFDDFWEALYERNKQQEEAAELRGLAHGTKNILDAFMSEGFTRGEAFKLTLNVFMANLHYVIYEEEE